MESKVIVEIPLQVMTRKQAAIPMPVRVTCLDVGVLAEELQALLEAPEAARKTRYYILSQEILLLPARKRTHYVLQAIVRSTNPNLFFR
jgi:hypothetical protein